MARNGKAVDSFYNRELNSPIADEYSFENFGQGEENISDDSNEAEINVSKETKT